MGRNDFRAAGRTPVHPVGQAPHLRVPALAGVASGGVGQPGYGRERLQERPAEYASAVFAAGRVASEGLEFVRLAERTGEMVESRGEGVFHLRVLSRYPSSPLLNRCTVPRSKIQFSVERWVNECGIAQIGELGSPGWVIIARSVFVVEAIRLPGVRACSRRWRADPARARAGRWRRTGWSRAPRWAGAGRWRLGGRGLRRG